MSKARYIMLGGFLGAGKSTAAGALAERLTARGLRVGLIVNDQGSGLVDTARLRSRGLSVEEIPGGCFCCRFASLVEAADRLAAADRPDVFIGEPVGSCTDLVATVSYPLRRIYGESYVIAPLSVLVDPERAMRMFGLAEGRRFSPKVEYIYRKQLEEADYIVINKIETLESGTALALRERLAAEFPDATILEASAREGTGLEAWFDRLMSEELPSRPQMEVDYEIYAEGEALLGWLNATLAFRAGRAAEADELVRRLAELLRADLVARGADIAHLKMTLSPAEGLAEKTGEIASVSVVRGDLVPELTQRLGEPVAAGELIVNIRAEAGPETLRESLERQLAPVRSEFDCALEIEHVEAFKPGKPVPTHRMAER